MNPLESQLIQGHLLIEDKRPEVILIPYIPQEEGEKLHPLFKL